MGSKEGKGSIKAKKKRMIIIKKKDKNTAAHLTQFALNMCF